MEFEITSTDFSPHIHGDEKGYFCMLYPKIKEEIIGEVRIDFISPYCKCEEDKIYCFCDRFEKTGTLYKRAFKKDRHNEEEQYFTNETLLAKEKLWSELDALSYTLSLFLKLQNKEFKDVAQKKDISIKFVQTKEYGNAAYIEITHDNHISELGAALKRGTGEFDFFLWSNDENGMSKKKYYMLDKEIVPFYKEFTELFCSKDYRLKFI